MLNVISAVQGIGAGGIFSLSEIILSDLVPLSERGLYKGILGLTWAAASTLGPIIVSHLLSHSACVLRVWPY